MQSLNVWHKFTGILHNKVMLAKTANTQNMKSEACTIDRWNLVGIYVLKEWQIINKTNTSNL